jgi:hypothetical protein
MEGLGDQQIAKFPMTLGIEIICFRMARIQSDADISGGDFIIEYLEIVGIRIINSNSNRLIRRSLQGLDVMGFLR